MNTWRNRGNLASSAKGGVANKASPEMCIMCIPLFFCGGRSGCRSELSVQGDEAIELLGVNLIMGNRVGRILAISGVSVEVRCFPAVCG